MILQVRNMIKRKCYDDGRIKLEASCFTYYDDCRLKCCTGGYDFTLFMMGFASEQAVYNQLEKSVAGYTLMLFTDSVYRQTLSCSGVTVVMKNIIDKLKSNYPSKVGVSDSCQVTLGKVYVAPKPTGLNRITVSMKSTYAGILVPNSGKWWGVKGVTASGYANIVMFDTALRTGSSQAINMSPNTQRVFTGNYKVFLVSTNYVSATQGGDPTATIEIIPPDGYVPTPLPAAAKTIPVEILIPNKVTGYTTYTFDVTIPEVRIPEVRIPEVRIPEPICVEGDEQKTTCPDGTVIITHICKKDPTTGITQWYPTGKPCPPPELGKVAKILVTPNGELMAYEGMDVTITAGVMCGATPSNGEPAILLIDGKEVARKNTSQGFVSLQWTATAEPSRTHKVVVSVPKSEQCPKYGGARDSKTITVSRMIPGIEERLRIEREGYKEQLAALREERKRIREMSLAERYVTPWITPRITPPVTPRITPPVTPPVEPPVTPPVEPPVEPPEQLPGTIDIPSIAAPIGIEYPVNIFIDGVLKGPPPLRIEVDPGKHEIRVELKNFAPLYRTVTIMEGQTLQITDLAFISYKPVLI